MPAIARQIITIHLRLDVHLGNAFRAVQAVHLNLVIKVADVTHDRLILHLQHVLNSDHIAVASRRDVDVGFTQRVFHGGDLEAFHRRLQGVDGVNFRDDDARTEPAQTVRAALAPHRRSRTQQRPCRRSSRRERASDHPPTIRDSHTGCRTSIW